MEQPPGCGDTERTIPYRARPTAQRLGNPKRRTVHAP